MLAADFEDSPFWYLDTLSILLRAFAKVDKGTEDRPRRVRPYTCILAWPLTSLNVVVLVLVLVVIVGHVP